MSLALLAVPELTSLPHVAKQRRRLLAPRPVLLIIRTSAPASSAARVARRNTRLACTQPSAVCPTMAPC
eukprot:11172801-Lingulodinium_polyedra.AAC.1